MKKKIHKKTLFNNHPYLPYLLPLFIILLMVFTITLRKNKRPINVLGQNTYTSQVFAEEDKESPELEKEEQIENKEKEIEKREPTEKVEPTEAKEIQETTEQNEQEVKDIQNEIENKIKQDEVETIEINPNSNNHKEGTVKIERANGYSEEKAAPTSNTPLIQLQNTTSGSVSASVGKNGTVTLVNNGITVTTNNPVIIDPQSQTVAIRTENGVTVINTLPAQAINGIKQADKPSVVQSATLQTQNNKAYYTVRGIQARKFVGLVPVSAEVETKIDAQDGSVITVDKPWYLNLLGFLYTI